MRISVIMPVFLGDYITYGDSRSASKPGVKFKRAVDSFLDQSFKDAELIIIADGDSLAENIYEEYWLYTPQVRFKLIAKQPSFSGFVRQTGIEMAQGEIICYLDHDDMFGKDHLKIINKNFDFSKHDWVYYNDFVILNADHSLKEERYNIISLGRIGTSSIAHKKSLNVVWDDGYEHDWRMIEKYLLPHLVIKIPTPEYYVCHVAGTTIDY